MKKSIVKLSLTFLVAISMFSCAPTTEGEQKAWERNQQSIKEMVGEYPSFAQVIETQAAEAATAMEAALNITEEEAKAEAMEQANEMISNSFIGDLRLMRHRLNDIGDKQIELKSMRMKREVVKRAENALKASYRSVNEVEEMISEGARTTTDAEKIAKDATSQLISAEGRLSGAIKAAKKSMKAPKSTKAKNS